MVGLPLLVLLLLLLLLLLLMAVAVAAGDGGAASECNEDRQSKHAGRRRSLGAAGQPMPGGHAVGASPAAHSLTHST